MKRAESSDFASRKRPGVVQRIRSVAFSLASGIFVVGYLGRFIEPNVFTWWIQLAAIPLPYIAIATGVLAGVQFLGTNSSVSRVAAAAVLLLIGIRFAPSWFRSGEGYDASTDFSLLTYNVPAERVRMAENGNARLGELVDQTNADIVCLQESYWYYRHDSPASTGRQDVAVLGTKGFNLKPPVDRTFGSEQVVVTTLPNRGASYTQHPSGPRDPDVLGILRSVVEWQGRPFAVFNIHLASYGSSKPWDEPSENRFSPRVWLRYIRDYRFAITHRAWQVGRVIELIQEEELPYLIVGDFNDTPHNWSYWKLAADMNDAFSVAGKGLGPTYHQKQPTFRIDYVLATDHFEVTSAQTLIGGVSDHLAVNATLRWRDENDTNR